MKKKGKGELQIQAKKEAGKREGIVISI